MNEYELEANLMAANPVDQQTVEAQMSGPIGDSVIREITTSGRPSFFARFTSSFGLSQTPSWGRAGYVGVLAAVIVAVFAINSGPNSNNTTDDGTEVAAAANALAPGAECTATGATLEAAKIAYSNNCQQPRMDCDPIDGQWVCSSQQIGSAKPKRAPIEVTNPPVEDSFEPTTTTTAAPVAEDATPSSEPAIDSSTSSEPTPVNPETTPTPAPTEPAPAPVMPAPVTPAPKPVAPISPATTVAPQAPPTTAPSVAPAPPTPGEVCQTSASSLAEAKRAFQNNCQQERADCDPIGGQWVCSSEQIGNASPGGSRTPAPSRPVQSPPSNPTPTPAPAPTPTSNGGTCVSIEAESLQLTGAWNRRNDSAASGGSYITWEGLSTARNNTSPADTINVSFDISSPGSYRFVWAMRQPGGVASDKANDSWVNFPNAARFGPTNGGTYSGFTKVFGNGKGNFAWAATADVGHAKSAIAIDFNRSGTYTMQLAGRSHGHQIDKIVIYPASVSRANAIAGRCGTATVTPAPQPAPAPTPSPTPAASNGPFNASRDLLSLHYDHAPDRDDGHATVAAKVVTDTLGIKPWVVSGAYGTNKNTYQPQAEAVMRATWGSGWTDAHANWGAAVTATANRWQQTLNNGGDIWIAEGGQSDLSADVIRELKRRSPGLSSKTRIHIVQHSGWNENNTTSADLNYVRANTDYIKIQDGNGVNTTADFNQQSSGWEQRARNSRWGSAWASAFQYLSPNQKLDFSDTVELMHIVGIPKSQVATVNDFANRFF